MCKNIFLKIIIILYKIYFDIKVDISLRHNRNYEYQDIRYTYLNIHILIVPTGCIIFKKKIFPKVYTFPK